MTSRAERVAEAQRLRAQGLHIREIAERMGVARSTADAYLSDPDLSKQRARRERYSRPCIDCGAPTDGSGGFKAPRERCRECNERHQHETRYWTPEAIVGALQAWGDAQGGIPPSAGPWLREGTPVGMPSVGTVIGVFGSWNTAIERAGFAPRARGHYGYGRDGEDMDLCREIRERYEAGESAPDLTHDYDCSIAAIKYRIVKAGGRLRSQSEAQRLRRDRERVAA